MLVLFLLRFFDIYLLLNGYFKAAKRRYNVAMNNLPTNNFMPFYGANNNAYGGNYGGYTNAYNNRQNTFAYVNGYTGAQAYIVPPNSTTVLLDSEKPFLYIKNSDGYGRAEVKAYEYKEYKEPSATTPSDYVTRQEFEELKKAVIGNERRNEPVSTNNAVDEQRQPSGNGKPTATK